MDMKDFDKITENAIRFCKENPWCTIFGLWGTNKDMAVGDDCPLSYDDSDKNGEYTPELLDGTCTIALSWKDDSAEELLDELDEKVEYHKRTYKYQNLYLVAGTGYEYGNDEYEYVIQNAVIVA